MDQPNRSSSRPSRRGFLYRAGASLSAALLSAGLRPLRPALAVAAEPPADASGPGATGTPPSTALAMAAPVPAAERPAQALALREAAARRNAGLPVVAAPSAAVPEAGASAQSGQPDGGKPPLFARYCKGLPHDDLGEPVPSAYAVYERSLASGKSADLEGVPLGGHLMLSNPAAAHAYSLEGCDPVQVEIAPPPAFESAETAAELNELFWMALCRDVPFADYESSALAREAGEALGRHSDFRGPRDKEAGIGAATLFRDGAAGSLAGPYLSQFLLQDVPYGATKIVQRYKVPQPGIDYLTEPGEWLSVQRGYFPREANVFDPQPRYLRNGRDLAEWTHRDFTYQAFLNAALILLGAPYARHEPRAPFARGNPYPDSLTQTGFVTFGGPHVLDLLPRVTSLALKASWYEKWLLFTRLRPEEMGGRLHHHLFKKASYPFHGEVLASPVLEKIKAVHGSYLLPQAYPEGCPAHPSYPAGHAAIAGACATVLKALFDERFPLLNPVTTDRDGLELRPYAGGASLTVGGEVDKLAANVSLGRSWAGIHWRSDSTEGLRVGERAAVSVLRDWRSTYPDAGSAPYVFTAFDGRRVTV